MKKLKYTNHLLNRIKLRKISLNLVNKIINSPELVLKDTINETKIAIGKEKSSFYMVAFLENNKEINIITIHPIKESQIKNRIKNKRWIVL